MRSRTRTRKTTPEESQRLVAENHRLVLAWSTRMHRRGFFPGWCPDDIAAAAYIAAVDLVDEKFDPAKGRIGTFLFTRLYSRVRYQWAADRGLKWDRTEKRWRPRCVELDGLEYEPVSGG
tara:strand:- start:5386 stop:5745 length:360 start_codon:yes stop_codon:yes gene_type:complete